MKHQLGRLRRRALLALLPTLVASTLGRAQSQRPELKLGLIEAFSGPFANTGEAVFRNVAWACERVNLSGGIALTDGTYFLRLQRYDSKGQVEEALSAIRSAVDDGCRVLLQGNSSAIASAIVDAVNKHNEREEAGRQLLFLNYSAVDPTLTNERCSFWHFRFDAHADMRMSALMDVLQADQSVRKVYLIGQDYSFGHAVLAEARRQLGLKRPDVGIVGSEFHPMGRVKDFAPYMAKIQASGADAVVTGNWGNDLTLLVKAARDAGFVGKFYTFYGNALGAPAAIGDAGVGRVIAVADWLPNAKNSQSRAFYAEFRRRFPRPEDDYVHLRMHLMIQALAQAAQKAGVWTAAKLGSALETVQVSLAGQTAAMRAADHQLQQPLMVGLMRHKGDPGVEFDVEGSGYGFEVMRTFSASEAQLPHSCVMARPSARA